MRTVDEQNKITLDELKHMAEEKFGSLVKAVVDVEKGKMVVGADLHVDEERLLLQEGSRQESLWGINLYPGVSGDEWIEFDSMINLRPHQNNLTRGVDDKKTRERIIQTVDELAER